MVLPIPDFFILRNNNTVTEILRNYLRSIIIEENFDANFTPSKLELEISSEFPEFWYFNDKLYVSLFWNQLSNVYTSDDFYVDYVDDSKSLGNQFYVLSGIEQNLTLTQVYKGESVSYSNNTILMALQNVASVNGFTLDHNVTSNVYLGTLPDTSQISTVTKKYTSYIDVIRDICNTYGYIGKLSGNYLEVKKLYQPGNIPSNAPIPGLSRLISIQSRNQLNMVAKQYDALYINRTGGNALTLLNLLNPSGISNKTIDLSDEGIYFNYESAYERTVGKLYQDYYKSFSIRLTYYAREYLKAGNYFYLDSFYGNYEGYYITLKVVHRMMHDSWVADVEAFPLKVLNGINLSFRILPISNDLSLPYNYNVSQTIDGYRS